MSQLVGKDRLVVDIRWAWRPSTARCYGYDCMG